MFYFTHAHTHTCTHTLILTHAHIHTLTHTHTHTHTHIFTHTHTRTHTHTHTHIGSINGAAVVPVERDKADPELVAAKVEKFGGHTWCFCNWLLTCFKKDEPAIGAANFEVDAPPTPEVRPHLPKLLQW